MSDEGAMDYRQDACTLGDVTVDGAVLKLTVSYTGGCERHRFDVLAGAVKSAEADAVAELVLAHDARGDPCKALVTEHLEFSLIPVLARHPQLPALRLTIGDRHAMYRCPDKTGGALPCRT